jgi:uncharacterized protein (DUF58 family)
LFGLAAADALSAWRRRGRISVQRDLSHAMPVGTWQNGRPAPSLRFRAAGERLADRRHPAAFLSEGCPALHDHRRRWLRVAYRVSVSERGRQVFDGVSLRCSSPLRLWLLQESIAVQDVVRVFPNFARIAHYTLLATDTACRRSVSCSAGVVARAWSSSSCATTGRTMRRGRSTGRPAPASAA